MTAHVPLGKAERGKKKTIDHVTVDYGVITYTRNPFSESTKILQLSGIKGLRTLATAVVVSQEKYIRRLEELLNHNGELDSVDLEHSTMEILVITCASHGVINRSSLSVEKLTVTHCNAHLSW
jgi:hypothetical protein